MRLNWSHEIPPKASGVTNSVARTRPKRSTIVSQTIEEMIQCRAARSVYGHRASTPAGACGSRTAAPGRAIARGTLGALGPRYEPDDERVIGLSFSRHPGYG